MIKGLPDTKVTVQLSPRPASQLLVPIILVKPCFITRRYSYWRRRKKCESVVCEWAALGKKGRSIEILLPCWKINSAYVTIIAAFVVTDIFPKLSAVWLKAEMYRPLKKQTKFSNLMRPGAIKPLIFDCTFNYTASFFKPHERTTLTTLLFIRISTTLLGAL
jgi:hypothetical protein